MEAIKSPTTDPKEPATSSPRRTKSPSISSPKLTAAAMPTLVDNTPQKDSAPPTHSKIVTPPKPADTPAADDDTEVEGGAYFVPGFNPDPQAGLTAMKRPTEPDPIAAAASSSARPQPKRSKNSLSSKTPLDLLDLSSPELIYQAFISLKGSDEQLPATIHDTLRTIYESYTKVDLAEFTKQKIRREWPLGRKSIGCNMLAQQGMHDLQCLYRAKGHNIDVSKLAWPPVDKVSTNAGTTGDSTPQKVTGSIGKSSNMKQSPSVMGAQKVALDQANSKQPLTFV